LVIGICQTLKWDPFFLNDILSNQKKSINSKAQFAKERIYIIKISEFDFLSVSRAQSSIHVPQSREVRLSIFYIVNSSIVLQSPA